jgi:phosphopantothenoylcysteine synthetase/decarboxylase
MTTNKQARRKYRILITAGPAVAHIDRVRAITNHSTGLLGTTLTGIAEREGHEVTLLRSTQCTAPEPETVQPIIPFTDGDSLLRLLESVSQQTTYDAIWHAAAVNDYVVDRICDETGAVLDPECKLASRSGEITLHLKPFTKIISRLKALFPTAQRVGWKYETDGDMSGVIAKALQQVAENETHASVANGPAYGSGFGVCVSEHVIIPAADATELALILLELLEKEAAA